MFSEILSIEDIDIRKRIAIDGAKNIHSLQNDPDLPLVWRQIRNQVGEILEVADEDFPSIKKMGEYFPIFYIDMWTEQPWGFNPVRNSGSLVVCLWSLLFHSIFLLSGGLVHEANHYRYLKCHDMLGRPEPEQTRFKKHHETQMEIDANTEQLGFFENVKKYFPEIVGPRGVSEDHILMRLSKSKIIEAASNVLERWKSGNYQDEYWVELSNTRKRFYSEGANFLGIKYLLEKGLPQRRLGFQMQFRNLENEDL